MKKGDKVVCDNDHYVITPNTPEAYKHIKRPVKGNTYTVREVVNTAYGTGLRFEEIRNEKIHHDIGGFQEPIFKVENFSHKDVQRRSATQDVLTKYAPTLEMLDVIKVK